MIPLTTHLGNPRPLAITSPDSATSSWALDPARTVTNASPVFRDPDGGLVVMLPTQADGKRAAERLEEIGRETVVGHLKRLADYESRVAELEALRSQILADGMLATARCSTTVRRAIQTS